MLTCTCCGKTKPRPEFYTQSYTGLPTNQCKECIDIKRSVKRHKRDHSKFVSKEKLRSMEAPNYTLTAWQEAMLYFGGRCAYCGKKPGRSKKDKFDREHLVPISRGGKTVKENIICACKTCNRSRGNKKLFEWYRAQPFWTAEREKKIADWMPIVALEGEGYYEE